MLEIKGKFINKLKLISLSFAVSQKNGKSYLIIEIDAINEKQQKEFIEVKDETEYKELINNVKNQMV
jgi:hypothetical protein